MDPVTLALMGASLAGGIMQGAGGKKMISPEWLKKHFGADAVNEEMISLFNNVINSPYGQQVMTDAASQGSQFERSMRSNTAAAGLSGGEGGSSGASIFSDSAAGGATKALTGQARAGIFQSVMPIAQNMVSQRLAQYMGQPAMNEPSTMSKFGALLGNAGAVGLSNMAPKVASPLAVAAPATAGEGTMGVSRLAMPNKLIQERMQSTFNTNAVQPSRFRASLGGSF